MGTGSRQACVPAAAGPREAGLRARNLGCVHSLRPGRPSGGARGPGTGYIRERGGVSQVPRPQALARRSGGSCRLTRKRITKTRKTENTKKQQGRERQGEPHAQVF